VTPRADTSEPQVGAPTPTLHGWTTPFTAGRLALLIGSLLFVEYYDVILGTHSFFNSDFGLFTCPVAQHTRTSFWRGEIPLWDPLNNCGVPFLAQWNTTVCYPLSWIYILGPLPWSLNCFCLGHLVLAGVGMYWLARRWTGNPFGASVAGVAFALNGLTFNCLMWTSNLAALSWMPLTVLCVERAWQEGGRRVVLAALVGAMQMLTGAPEIIFLTWALLGTLWLGAAWRRWLPLGASAGRLALVAVLMCGLAALQLLPFFELLQHSDREAAQNPGAWSMCAWGWANFIVPLFRCSKSILGPYYQVEQQWTSSYYVGIGVVALAVVAVSRVKAPRVWWLAATAVGGIVLALGPNSFLYPLVRHIVPAFGLVRYPIKFIVPTVFALPLLAGFAVDWISQPSPTAGHPHVQKWLAGAGLLVLAALAGILAFSRLSPYPGESWQVTFTNGAERAGFLAFILGAVFVLAKASQLRTRRWLGAGILILLGLDCLTHAPCQNPTVSMAAYGPLAFGMSPMPQLGQSRAMVSPQMQAILQQAATPNPFVYFVNLRRALYENCNLLDGVPKVNGFFSLHLREEAAVESLLYTPTNFPSALADFLGAAQISSSKAWFEWSARDTALPSVTSGQQALFASDADTLRALASSEFNPRRQVYLPLEARGLIQATNAAPVTVSAQHFSPHRITLSLTAAAPALVVVAQSFFPAWRARVDGQSARLWRANHGFQAVEVPGGSHQVELVYRDACFNAGVTISACTLLGCLVLLFLFARNRAR